MTRKTLTERFWAKVEKTDTCWNWTASKDHKGYGYFGLNGKTPRAHRVAWELIIGPIPDGIQLDHTCFNKSCVNPAHLRHATNKQNHEHRPGPQQNNTSGIRGVAWHKRGKKWMASVCHNGKHHYLGLYADIADAEAAVLAKRRELFTHDDAA